MCCHYNLRRGTTPTSGYVNMTHDLNVAADTLMYNGNYRGNVNVQDWVIQSEMTYNTLAEQRAIISGGRVIKDFEKGVCVSRSETMVLQIYERDFKDNRWSVVFNKHSLVSMLATQLDLLDESHVQTTSVIWSLFQKMPEWRLISTVEKSTVVSYCLGSMSLRIFLFKLGRNTITILVVGREGVLSETELEYFYNPSLLAKGQRELQGTLGMPYIGASNIAQIDAQRLAGLVYSRYGFTNHIGGTAYLQAVQNKDRSGRNRRICF